jgi:hypothetical protein
MTFSVDFLVGEVSIGVHYLKPAIPEWKMGIHR